MKNLKIGTKIMFGFGCIILLMLIFVFVVIFITTSTVANVDGIYSGTALQTMAKDLMSHYYDARANAQVVYIRSDNSAYAEVLDSLNKVSEEAQNMYEYIDSNEYAERFRGEVDEALTWINEWKQTVSKVQQSNQTMDQIAEKAYVNQMSLVSKSMGILDYQLELARGEVTESRDDAYKLRRIDRLEFGADLAQNIDEIGSSFELIIKSGDLSQAAVSKAVVQETVDMLTGFLEESTLKYNIDTSNSILQALDTYNRTVDSFIEVHNYRTALISEVKAIEERTMDAMNKLSDEIDSGTGELVASTSRGATSSRRVVITISAVSLIFAVLFSMYLAGIISRPIEKMHNVLDQAGLSGDLTFSPQIIEELNEEARARDEIGRSMSSFVTLIGHLSKTGEQLSRVAEGDLAVDVSLISERDTIGTALKRMMLSLNHMFGEIHEATDKVAVGSKQIADGAQILAQGATEQAAAVEQLSATINEVAGKTKENADMAVKAADLANGIKSSAEKGSKQMEQMINAVEEISEASRGINKVIKVIDDIAFQTNILALNASVEAARAGQHGKGFAVVAGEVRNLAAKSAEAAKNTSSLIVNSMEKAELGVRIAGETAESLAEIVEGIGKSNQIVGEIAKSSEEQASSIEGINRGIGQVAQVVQQNSATAEQSAAASEQMSGQADVLENLIAHFKLKDAGNERTALDPAESGFNMPSKESGNIGASAEDGEFGKY